MENNATVKYDEKEAKTYISQNSIDQVIFNPRLAKQTFTYHDVIPYGNYDNLYPQKVLDVASRSWALSTALETYQDFMIGNGFNDNNELVINEKGQTLFELLRFITRNKRALGFAVHVNYNALGQIVEFQSINYEDLRFDQAGLLVYNPDWNNPNDPQNKEKETTYNLYNPETALQEANEVGFEKYTGQVLYWKSTNNLYPLATFDACLEAGQYQYDQELFKLRNIQNGFSLSGAFTYPKNLENQQEKSEFKTMLNSMGTGANNSGRIWAFGVPAGVEGGDKLTNFIPFERSNIDNLYTNQNKESREAIFSTFRQPAILNAISDTGMFNQQSLQDAFVFYNSIVEKDRKEIEKTLNKMFADSIYNVSKLEIEPKMLINATEEVDEIENNGNDTTDTDES